MKCETEGGILLQLTRLNRIIEIDEDVMTVTVQAVGTSKRSRT